MTKIQISNCNGAKFIFRTGEEGNYQYLAKKQDGSKYLATSESDANKYSTDNNGNITITDILNQGPWYAKEVEAPEGYRILEKNWMEMTSEVILQVQNEKYANLKIYKHEEGNNNIPLNGAKFIIKTIDNGVNKWIYYKADGTTGLTTKESEAYVFRTGVDGADGYIEVSNLIRQGPWYAKEIEAPQGYEITNSDYVELQSDVVKSFSNKPIIETIDLKIEKVNQKNTATKLPGAVFKFKNLSEGGKWLAQNAQGEYILVDTENSAKEFTTSSSTQELGQINLTGVPLGQWEAHEIRAPEGYKILSETVKLTNNEKNIITNKPNNLVTLQIEKVSEKNSNVKIEKAKFRFKTTEGKWLGKDAKGELDFVDTESQAETYVTDVNGKINITEVPEAQWIAYEIEAPTGYTIKNSQGVQINNNTTNIIYNKPITIEIEKVDSENNSKKLPGAEFTFENSEGKWLGLNSKGQPILVSKESANTWTTGNDGKITIDGVSDGQWKAHEIKAPQGYQMKSSSVSIVLNQNNVIKNEKNIDLEVVKVDSKDQNKKLPGAKFTFENATLGKWLGIDEDGKYTLVNNEQSANTFTTDKNGSILLQDIVKGEWKAHEKQAPSGYKIISNTVTLTPNSVNKISNLRIINLQIQKVDSHNSSIKLAGAKFTFKNVTEGKWLSQDAKGNYIFVDNEANAKVFTTDDQGLITLRGVEYGEWEAYEKEAPAGYKVLSQTVKLIHNNPTTVKNMKIIDLEILKVDKENANIKLPQAKFTLKNTTLGKWLTQDAQGNYSLVDSEANAKIFTTDTNGKITLKGVEDGDWEAYEKQAPEGYKIISGTIKLEKNKTTTITNSKRYVTIEGIVFEDGQQGKTSTLNNLYDEGEGVNGVRVILKRNGKEIANIASGYSSKGTKCAKNGQYQFDGDQLKIEREKLSEYEIAFMYNGMEYESLENTTTLAGNGSKAKENANDRTAFNTKYSQVTANTKIANGQSTNKAVGGNIIRYQSKDNTSQIIYQTSAKDMNGKAYDNTLYADDQYHITSSTKEAGLNLGTPNTKGGYPFDPTKDLILDINFGIAKREHPDVAISSDLSAAETSINGYTQIYKYQKRYDLMNNGDDNSNAYSIKIKSSDATYNQTYERKLYKSDVEYAVSNSDGSELAVYLTYKISIKNQSSTINVTVNDIVNYFSKDLSDSIIAIGTKETTLAEINPKSNDRRYIITNEDGMKVSGKTEDSGYNKQYITLNKEIKTGSKYEFYVQFKMKREGIIKTLNGDVNFNNVVELNTCSAKKNNGKIWTAVDKDSAVGNCVPSDKATMEDDTDYAPTVKISIDRNERQISGIVFEDATTLKDQERKGNGTYDTGEKGVKNVTVQLVDIDRGTIAYSNTNGTNITSGSNGNYTIHGFIPGNYIIKYTYGNGTDKYTAQQYKSTIYVDQTRANKNYANGYHDGVTTGGNIYWYLENTNERKSDAIDNYNGEMQTLYKINNNLLNKTRIEIDSQWNEGDGMQHIYNGTEINKNLAIDAFTPHLAIPVEKTGAKEGEYTVSNVDFGIAERPRYKVQIQKEIARIQLIQPDGSILRDFTDFNNPPANTKAMKTTTGKKGFVQFEIDTELLQTTTLLVEYKFTATNKSEVEYKDEVYYKYGTVPTDKENTIVRVAIPTLIDYVDNELMYSDNSKMITDGNTNITNKNNGWSTIDLSQNVNKKYLSEEVLKALYDGSTCKYSTIIISKGLDIASKDKMMKPGETKTIGLSLNKTLAPTQEDMHYENTAEIVEVKKTWGRELSMEETTSGAGDGQKLGNLDPTDEKTVIKTKDPDSSYAEKIIINQPTGANKNFTIYTILGITCFAILAGGIILIKKKVL